MDVNLIVPSPEYLESYMEKNGGVRIDMVENVIDGKKRDTYRYKIVLPKAEVKM